MLKFKSKYTEATKEISPAQYIAEIICERIAAKDKDQLPVKFWSTEKWKKIFMRQVFAANGLLKIYHPLSVIYALRQNPKTYSLHVAWLNEDIKHKESLLYQLTPHHEADEFYVDKEEVIKSVPRAPQKSNSMWNKLK